MPSGTSGECKVEPFNKEFTDAIVKDAKRRRLVVNATCHHCGEIFLRQQLDYILAHTKLCKGRDPEDETHG